MTQGSAPNVIIFGEPGVGKSSIVNMILGEDKAELTKGATGRKFESAHHSAQIAGATFNLHDTAGLGDSKIGTSGDAKASKNLGQLVKQLSDDGGVNLLVFVMKCGRLTKATQKNYKLFKKYFHKSDVPIVIVVTGCEDVEPMDNWWTDNEELFTNASMKFKGHACVCTYRGREAKEGGHVNDEQFDKSKDIVTALIRNNCLSEGWRKSQPGWFVSAVAVLKRICICDSGRY